MSCPNKNLQEWKDLVSFLDEDKANVVFRMNNNTLPNYKKHPQYTELKKMYNPQYAFNVIYGYDVARYNKQYESTRPTRVDRSSDLEKFVKRWGVNQGGYLNKEVIPGQIRPEAKRLGLTVEKREGDKNFRIYKNNKKFDPTRRFRLAPSLELNKENAAVVAQEKRWIKSVLGNSFPVDIAHRLILGKGWGHFGNNAITLYKYAGEGTGYHEAFHAVFRMALKPSERDALMEEMGARKGNDKLSLIELEEKMADEFMEYMLNDGDIEMPEITPKQKSWFENLLDMITFWVSSPPTLNNIYSGIAEGRFKDIHIDPRTAMTGDALKKIPIAFDRVNADREIEEDSMLTEQESVDIMEAMDTIFFKILFRDTDPDNFFKRQSSELAGEVYDKVREELAGPKGVVIRALRQAHKEYGSSSPIVLDRERLFKNVFGLTTDSNGKLIINDSEEAKDKWVSVVNFHQERVADYGIKFVAHSLDSDMGDENVQRADNAMYNASIEMDTKDGLPPAMKSILLGLESKTYDSRNNKFYKTSKDFNELFLPKNVSPGEAYNTLANALIGHSGNYVEMLQKLKEFAKRNPHRADLIKVVMDRLDVTTPEKNATRATHRLRTQFVEGFSKTKYDYLLTLIRKDGKIAMLDANTASLSNKLLSTWESNFRSLSEIDENNVPLLSKGDLEVISQKLGTNNKRLGAELFLDYLGITLTDEKALLDKYQGESLQNRIGSAVKAIKGKDLINPFGADSGIKGLLNAIAEVEAKYSEDVVELNHVNPEGKTVYSIALHTYITNMADKLNNFKGDREGLLEAFPFLDSPYLDNSVILNKLLDGEASIKVGLHEGVKSEESGNTGMTTKDLGLTDKAIQTINSALKGFPSLLRAADRGLENFIGLSTKELLVPPGENGSDEYLLKVFRGYLADEVAMMKNNDLNESVRYYDNNNVLRDKKGKEIKRKFRFFEDIFKGQYELNIVQYNELLKSEYGVETVLDNNSMLSEFIDDAIINYFDSKVSELKQFLKEDAGLQNKQGIDSEILQRFDNDYDRILKYALANSSAGFIENSKLFVGDIAFFKNTTDVIKRVSMFNSSKRISRNDSDYNFWANENLKRKDGKQYNGKMNTIIFNDVRANTKVKQDLINSLTVKYGETRAKEIIEATYNSSYEEADAQGYVTLDEYREILDRAGKWTDDMEEAYLQSINGESITTPEVFFTPLKTQYAGPLADVSSRTYITTGYKHSILPLIPEIIEGTVLGDLNTYMETNQIGMAQFVSGNKFGTLLNEDGKLNEFYTEDGDMSWSNTDLKQQSIFYDFFGIQVDTVSNPKTKITPGTQQAKIVTANLYNNGEPINSKAGDLEQEYTDIINKISAMQNVETKKNLGLGYDEEADSYYIQDMKTFSSTLYRINKEKGATDNIKDAIATYSEGDYIDFIPNGDKVQSTLTSYVTKNIMKFKRPGGAKIQVASTGFINVNKEARKTGEYGSDELQFYRNKNGKITGMQVKLPHYFKEIIGNVNDAEIDDYLKKLVGFRIPTQAAASIELIEVAGFLPPSAGDMIIVPSEHVAKGGSDFDVDKLNIYFPHYEMIEVETSKSVVKKYKINTFDLDIKGRGPFRGGKHGAYSSVSQMVENPAYLENIENIEKVFGKDSPLLSDEFQNKIERHRKDNMKVSEGVTEDIMFKYVQNVNNIVYELYNEVQRVHPEFLKGRPRGEERDLLINESVRKPQYIKGDGNSNDIKKLQNRLLEIQMEIMNIPEYNADQVSPIDSKELENLRDVIADLRDQNITDTSTTDVFSLITNLEKFRDFLAGKAGIGQVAVSINHHILSQKAGLVVEPWADNMFFPANYVTIDGVKHLSLSGVKDQAGNYILDSLSSFLNAYVDIAKDPFVFDLNAGPETANTIFFMLRAGVPLEHIMHFVSQPIIVEYAKAKVKNDSEFVKAKGLKKSAGDIVKDVFTKFESTEDDTLYKAYKDSDRNSYQKGTSIGSLQRLYKKNPLTLQTLKTQLKLSSNPMQKRIFDEFLIYEQQAAKLQKSVKLRTADTKAMGKSFNSLRGRKNLLEEIESDSYLKDENKISDSTLLKEMDKAIDDYSSVFENMIFMKNDSHILDSIVSLLDGPGVDSEALMRDIRNQYTTYAFNVGLEMDTVNLNREDVESILSDKEKLRDVMNELKWHPELRDKNPLVKEFITSFNKGTFKTNGLSLYTKKLATYKSNVLISSFRELFDYYVAVQGIEKDFTFGELLMKIGLVQSGVGSSLNDFNTIIPQEHFKANLQKYTQAGLYTLKNIEGNKKVVRKNLNDFITKFQRHNIKYIKPLKRHMNNNLRKDYHKNSTEGKQMYLKHTRYDRNLKEFITDLYVKELNPQGEVKVVRGKVKFVLAGRGEGQLGNYPHRLDYRSGFQLGNNEKIDTSTVTDEESEKTEENCNKAN